MTICRFCQTRSDKKRIFLFLIHLLNVEQIPPAKELARTAVLLTELPEMSPKPAAYLHPAMPPAYELFARTVQSSTMQSFTFPVEPPVDR